MATLEFPNKRINWWLGCFTTSEKSWNIANTFVNSLECDKEFTHTGEHGPRTASFHCNCAGEKVYISLDIEGKDEASIIFTEDLGVFLKVPKNRYEIYRIEGTHTEIKRRLEHLINGLAI